MKTIKYILLIILWLFTFWAIASESETMTLGNTLILKLVGFGVGFLTYRLTTKWYNDGSLPALGRFIEEDDDE